jgi:DNA-binding response OmpR family regulator
MRLLVVDDDFEVRDLLARALERDGHDVTAVPTVSAARTCLQQQDIDVVVLDLALPDGTGVDLCEELRASRDSVPVLMLTAHSEVAERVRALDAGADDFLAKPFAVAELRARVRALGRRRGRPLSAARAELRDGVYLDFEARTAKRRNTLVRLTPREWIILETLFAEAGRVVTRAALLNEGWGNAAEAQTASLEVLIGRIRRKLGEEVIRTVRGSGYSLGSA